MIRIRYFASLREAVGTDLDELPPQAAGSVAEISARLCAVGGAEAEALAEDRWVLAAVNQQMARADTPVSDGDELAFFRPVTGG
jgi:molybdopterin synthase sulfur carrier subunit